jgi:hypothetical protein
MAFPAYSIVVIEQTVSNVTSLTTQVFKSLADAKIAYNNAVSADKRAFLYEKPQPTSFKRKDSQPMSA